jgi:hypothetical protein
MEENQEATESKIEELALTAVLIIMNNGLNIIGINVPIVEDHIIQEGKNPNCIYLKKPYIVIQGPQSVLMGSMLIYNQFTYEEIDAMEFRFHRDNISLILTDEKIDATLKGILAQEKAARANIQIVGNNSGRGPINNSPHGHPHGHRRQR